jgi:23S rRNA (guanosine2251-2'-O)-methyltransferase
MRKREWDPIKRRPKGKGERPPSRRRNASERPRIRAERNTEETAILYGWHTVKSALENPARRIRKLWATENAARRLAADGVELRVTPDLVRPDAIAARLGPEAVHQGLMAEADPLDSPTIEDIRSGIVLVLDQITDPHNVGAIFRSAAAPSGPVRNNPAPG